MLPTELTLLVFSGEKTETHTLHTKVARALSRSSFPFIKNCGICLNMGRKSVRLTQSGLIGAKYFLVGLYFSGLSDINILQENKSTALADALSN